MTLSNGLAVVHVRYIMNIDKQAILDKLARKNPRRMQLINILSD